MGLTVVARVVVGFELTLDTVQIEKTKYDEDTGTPYKVMVDSHLAAMCEGKQVADSKENPDAFCAGESIEGLEIFDCGYYGEYKNKCWLGRVMEEIKYEPGAKDFKSYVPGEVSAFAIKHGLTPKQTFILYIS